MHDIGGERGGIDRDNESAHQHARYPSTHSIIMQVANARLVLNKVGSDVPIFGLTPAEAMVLHLAHQVNNGGKTFGDEMEKINLLGDAMEPSGKFKKVVDVPAVAEKIVKGALLKPAQPAQLIKGKVIKEATPEQLIKGTDGKPDTKIPAQAAVCEPDIQIPAQEAVYAADTIVPAQDEVSHDEPIMVKRTDIQEFRRLMRKYGHLVNKKGDNFLKLIWPGLNPVLPQNFSDLKAAELLYNGLEVAAVDYVTGKPVA